MLDVRGRRPASWHPVFAWRDSARWRRPAGPDTRKTINSNRAESHSNENTNSNSRGHTSSADPQVLPTHRPPPSARAAGKTALTRWLRPDDTSPSNHSNVNAIDATHDNGSIPINRRPPDSPPPKGPRPPVTVEFTEEVPPPHGVPLILTIGNCIFPSLICTSCMHRLYSTYIADGDPTDTPTGTEGMTFYPHTPAHMYSSTAYHAPSDPYEFHRAFMNDTLPIF